MTQPFPSWPQFTHDERAAVDRVLASGRVNYWTGDEGRLFEEEFARWCGASHGICVSSGTIALEIALRACGIEDGDQVIVSPRSFLASAAAVAAVGAEPVFADIDPDSGNITSESVTAAIGERTRGILPVHLAGWPADMPAITEIADRHGLIVIEDCAQSHGATIDGRHVGTFGNAAIFSFCNDKIISTCGEGGMVTTSDDNVRDRVRALRDHGRGQDAGSGSSTSYRWSQDVFGTNGRMTEVQATVGRCQLAKVDQWNEARAEVAANLASAIRGLPGVSVPRPGASVSRVFYRLGVRFEGAPDSATACRDRALSALLAAGVCASVGACPEIYRERAFQDAGHVPAAPLPVATDVGVRSLALPVHPTLLPVAEQLAAVVTASLGAACDATVR